MSTRCSLLSPPSCTTSGEHGQSEEYFDGWIDRWVDGWIEGWVDGWMDVCMPQR